MKRMRFGLLLAVALGAGLLLATSVRAEPPARGGEEGGDGEKRSIVSDVSMKHGAHGWAFECTASTGGANTRLDCDEPFPNNEPQIVVDPTNSQHMIASSNDYGSCCDQYYTTFNGGTSWSTGNMSIENPRRTGSDPVTSFDRKHGVALHSSLNYTFSPAGETCDGDVVVSPSYDGGLTWLKPAMVDDGVGCDSAKTQLFNDKEWIVTDNNPASPHYGRTYLTWSKFVSHDGDYASSAIWESQSDDGGLTWTGPREISGSNNSLCQLQADGPAGRCDQNQFSVPTVAPNGTVYVAFQNEQNQALQETGEVGENQYLLVKSTNGGATWSAPSFIIGLEDGSRDYPLNVNGRQTLTGYQVRVNSAGNIVASPVNGALYLAFSDNRNGTTNSTTPVTNTDVFVMSSTDGGTTWSSPSQVDTGAGDQWFPWVDVNPVTGTIGVLYHDRGAANGATYTTALAEGIPGSLAKTTLSTAASNPTQSRYFRAGVTGCANCALFHGDYISVAYGSDGHANAAWTDMRDPSELPGLFFQFIYFARK